MIVHRCFDDEKKQEQSKQDKEKPVVDDGEFHLQSKLSRCTDDQVDFYSFLLEKAYLSGYAYSIKMKFYDNRSFSFSRSNQHNVCFRRTQRWLVSWNWLKSTSN